MRKQLLRGYYTSDDLREIADEWDLETKKEEKKMKDKTKLVMVWNSERGKYLCFILNKPLTDLDTDEEEYYIQGQYWKEV
jgi:hypothetical protein